MSKLAINVNIGSRVYPLTITAAEEELIREAAKRVNENMKQLENTYEVRDKQDLLAMTSLFFANKLLESEKATMKEGELTQTNLKALDRELTQYLENIK